MYDDFFSKAHELVQQGVPFVTVTVVRADRPTSAKPGDKAIITAQGTMHGWIGGSCAQPTVIREALKALAEEESRLIRLSPEPDNEPPQAGRIDLPMTCFSGGTLELFIEPQPPRPRLLIVGTLPVARALAQLGQAMNYHVAVVDLDGGAADIPHADEVIVGLDGIEAQVRPNTFVVVATHGYHDEVALEKVLAARPLYVGLVASRKRARAVREYLVAQGVPDEAMVPLKAPAGLDIRARRGDEIALSIMAEIVQKRRLATLVDLSLFEEAHADGVAIDPVCGMEVEVATATYQHRHGDESYVFCCAGCQRRFAAEPEAYLRQPAPAGEAIDPVCQMRVEIAKAQHMAEYDGALYYFCCAGCRDTFNRTPTEYARATIPHES